MDTPLLTNAACSASKLGGQHCCAHVHVNLLCAWNVGAFCGRYAAQLASLAAAKSRGQRRQFPDGYDLISPPCKFYADAASYIWHRLRQLSLTRFPRFALASGDLDALCQRSRLPGASFRKSKPGAFRRRLPTWPARDSGQRCCASVVRVHVAWFLSQISADFAVLVFVITCNKLASPAEASVPGWFHRAWRKFMAPKG